MMVNTSRSKGGTFVAFLIVLFVLVAAGTFAYLQKTGKLSGLKVNMFSSIGSDELFLEEGITMPSPEQGLSIGVTKEDVSQGLGEEPEKDQSKEIVPVSSDGKQYEKIAEKGDSITTLARKAVKQYLDENSQLAADITREHKIFMEDYIQNRIGNRVLQVNEKVVVSEDLINEALNQAQKLTAGQLENLRNFSELVWTPGF